MTRREALALAWGAVLGLAGAAAAAQNYAPESLARWFRFEWKASGAKLTGYLYNQTNRAAARMQLLIEGLDGSGKVTGKTTTWVLGGAPPNNRAYFEAPVPKAASYRVSVLSFEWLDETDRRRW